MKINKVIRLLPLLVGVLLFVQCSSDKKNDNNKPKSETKITSDVKMAYIDSDSLFSKYNFAKDVSESTQRSRSQLESAHRQKLTEIQRFAQQVDNKYKSGQYLTAESFNADKSKLDQMQADAERYLASLESQLTEEINLSMKQVGDSIDKCVKEYAKKNGMGVVLDEKSSFYVDGITNITDEVVKELNSRYVKVEKKK